MWVASVTPLTGFNFSKNPILMPIYLMIILFYYANYCWRSKKPLFYVLGIFVIWFISSCLKYHSIQPFQFPPLYSIAIAHIAFNIFEKKEFLKFFEEVLVKLCILSLVVWGAANIFGGPFVDFMHSIAVLENTPPTETNSIVVGLGSQFEMGIRRNIGFTWEPGRFACWIILGLYVNMVRHNFSIVYIWKNINFVILLITLLSTFSTTGYSALGVILLCYLMNKKSNIIKILIIVASIFIIPTILAYPFMKEKIIALMDIESDFQTIMYYKNATKMSEVCPQRFTGLYVSLNNFIHDIFLGFGHLKNSYTTSVVFANSIIVAPSEGILGILAKYGFFVGAFFYYWLFKSSIYLSKAYHYSGKYLFFILFLTISFSYDFWECCILMYFYLCAFYKKYDDGYFDGGIEA
jgi:hypothetical protein